MYSKSPEKIRKMFDNIALKYDFMNNIISLGLHNFIKKKAVNKLNLKNDAKVLDLCCGTGDIAKILATKKEVKSVTGVDFSEKMLEVANKKNSNGKIKYINADCTNLPCEDNSFDIITIFFGLRNIENSDKVISEIYRILAPKGQVLHLDFKNENILFDFLFDKITPFWAKIFTKNSEAYEYLVKSKKEFYSPKELEKLFLNHNFKQKNTYSFLFSTIIAQVFEK